jgi:molecular chaperone Hsp33
MAATMGAYTWTTILELALADFPPRDYVRPFIFEHLDIRGAFVQLHDAWEQMLAGRDYPPPVMRLLGEMTAVTTLVAANLKQRGRMTFQLKGAGPVGLLVLDCDEQLHIRGMAHGAAAVADAPVPELLGDGRLVLTLDVPGMRQPYQSHVPLDGDTIAAIFEHYLERSEQQPARLWLAAGQEAAAGLFLQKLPGADLRDADGWNRVTLLAGTVKPDELLTLPSVKFLTRMFPEEDLRVFDPRPVSYQCPEDWDKIHGMLRDIGRAECEAILTEQGEIRVQDEICNREYVLDRAAVAALFDPDAPSSP